MLHNVDLILTLAGGLSAALVLGFITQKLRMSPIVGYLLAGIIVGPYSPGFVADADTASQCAEIGIILLMFGVGLHFHLKDLLAVQRIVLPGAAAQIGAATLLGMVVSHGFGWSWAAGAVFGMAISVASTVVLTRVLSDNKALHTTTGHVALGWLVVEDLFTILLLVLLPAIVGGNEQSESVWHVLAVTTLKLGALVVFALVVGQRIIPKLLAYVARTGTRDLFTLSVLVLALGVAVGAANFFGASMALGAFLSGMVVGQSEFSSQAAAEALPMRDAFAVLFFVSVGMLFNPASLISDWPLILATLGIVLIGKPLAAFIVVKLFGQAFAHGPFRRSRTGADRRIFLHPRRDGRELRRTAQGSFQRDHRDRDRFHHPQPPALPAHQRGGPLAGIQRASGSPASMKTSFPTPKAHSVSLL